MDLKYSGMTVNERLFVAGLLNEFETAAKARDIDRVRSILVKVELTEANVLPILRDLGFLD